MKKIIIYQIMVRLFGNKKKGRKFHGSRKKNGVGKFKDIDNRALSEIKKLGISHIWATGVLEHAIIDGYRGEKITGNNPQIVKGRAGSPYAIKDYYDVNPDLAVKPRKRMREFEALVSRIQQHGLKIIIDFVPNHVAREYFSDKKPVEINNFGDEDDPNIAFTNQNDFYYLPNRKLELPEKSGTVLASDKFNKYEENPAKATGNDKFQHQLDINDWYDTVKLNYGVDYTNGGRKHFEPIPSVWRKMLDIIQYWASKGVDGFRCDMAEMVPLEFWEWMIPQVKEKHPDLIFIAEIYQPHLYKSYHEQGGFDYLYDKVGTYDTLRNIMQHDGTASKLTQCWQQLEGINDRMLRFLENHDEQRLASKHFLKNPWIAVPGIILSATFHNGPAMIYFGQEVGEPANGASGFSSDDGRTTIYDYWHVPEHLKWMNNGKFDGKKLSANQKKLRFFYQKLFNLCKTHKNFSEGKFYDLMWVNQHTECNVHKVFAYLRYTDTKRYLVVLNFDKKEIQNCRIIIPPDAFSLMGFNSSDSFLLIKDRLWGTDTVKFSSSEAKEKGIPIHIDAHSGKIFEISLRL